MSHRLLLLLLAWPVATALGAPASPASSKVRVEICEEGIPADNSWPSQPVVTEAYEEDVFGVFELPQKYVSTGVRADRAFPTLVRASARVVLPVGRHRVLLRSRGAARLTMDHQPVLATPFDQPRQFALGNGGELPVEEQDAFLDLGPGYRFCPPGNRESWGIYEVTSTAPVDVVLEVLVGGLEPKSRKPFRPELGETVVAIALEGTTDWQLLTPGPRRIRYTDAAWAAYEEERRRHLAATNQEARTARLQASAPYWDRRRAAARAWLAATPETPVPALPPGYPAHNAIDHFLAQRIARAAAEQQARPAGGVDFHREIRPILESQCYSCHQGNRAKGGLRLDEPTAARQGGRSDGPAVIAGHPERSPIIQRITSQDAEEVMPAKGDPLPARDIALLRRWIADGAPWPEFPDTTFTLPPLADDLTFLRRVTLDTVGVIPTEAEIAAFQADRSPDRRARLIDRLLEDPRAADHAMGYWLDVLAENPNLINPTLNNTGPFRWWLYEALLDHKPLDLFATELVRLEGSERFGGPAGFGVASQNDVPMAAKGLILSSAFLGVEMKCARCHDAPTHVSKQKDLFELAALLETKPLKVPATSSVAMDQLRQGGREPLIEVTLAPGTSVAPAWPFARYCDEATAAPLAERPGNPRDRLAALLTAPQNERFAQVMVNRLWQRFMGRGLVEHVGDWEKSPPSHPELLRWLGRELVRSGYQAHAIARLILNSHAYQRASDPRVGTPSPLFLAPAPRRLGAEQLVDSFHVATGKPFRVEPVNLDVDSVRTIDNALDLGCARRSWMLASTSNERDRPSLTLPRTQAVAEVLEVFGWRGARPDPISGPREVAANVLQPALLSNGTLMLWLTRLGDDHGLTAFAREPQDLDGLIDRLFLRMLTRLPSPEERRLYHAYLAPGFASRVVDAPTLSPETPPVRRKFVAWSNHMKSEANRLRLEEAEAARRGDPPTARLVPAWRERFEDVIWALLNAPEWIHLP
ncbi:MAG: DUF1553 domain-containing protein [Verrucomicrobia bacterium]|nr:DUF1553 domain-containing protein [Verrucomicrobiota bacterium]